MELKKLVIQEAAKIDEVMRRDIDTLAAGFDPLLIDILDYGLFSGGKRLRPFLTCRRTGCAPESGSLGRLGRPACYKHQLDPPGPVGWRARRLRPLWRQGKAALLANYHQHGRPDADHAHANLDRTHSASVLVRPCPCSSALLKAASRLGLPFPSLLLLQ